MNTPALNDDSTTVKDAAQLEVAARKAHEQKRIKECMSLINQLLLCDPGNREAQTLRAAVFADIERDVSDARVLLADSQSREDGHKYRKAAEIILLKILYLDPTHAEAKGLLATARASAERPQSMATVAEAPKPKPPMLDELRFTTQRSPIEEKAKPRSSSATRKLPVLVCSFVVLAGAGLFLYRPHSDAAPEVAVDTTSRAVPKSARSNVDAMPTQIESSHVALAPSDVHVALAATGVAPIVTEAPGLLSVSSPTSAEIYLDGKYLGEAPTTLQLPAGTQTLEYRHGDLRTTLTHEIKTKETTNVVVNFDVTVQINARPWAQVFVDGTVRKPLGQTPLGSVRVPVGSVLAFENPNFPSKTYRVTDKDSSIQVVFP